MKKQTFTFVLFCLVGFSMFLYACQKEDNLIESGDILNKTHLMQYDSIPIVIDLNETELLTVTDYDGNVYQTIQIGDQVWMAENLKTTRYNNGRPIPMVPDNATWLNLSSPAFCAYKNNRRAGNAYGALYNWYAVATENICPPGWHVPSDTEWTILTDYLGEREVAGHKLKEEGTLHWSETNILTTNSSGFTALPGGKRVNGVFGDINTHGFWWTSTGHDDRAQERIMYSSHGRVVISYALKQAGQSIRCVKNPI